MFLSSYSIYINCKSILHRALLIFNGPAGSISPLFAFACHWHQSKNLGDIAEVLGARGVLKVASRHVSEAAAARRGTRELLPLRAPSINM